jgi:hypothetical protein
MFNTNLPGDEKRKPDSRTFTDGDTLVTVLPSVVDFHCVIQLQQEIDRTGGGPLKKILFDFSPVQKLTATGISAFIGLGMFSLEKGIELLMLESSTGIRGQLAPLLPAAVWIDQKPSADGHVSEQYRSSPGTTMPA